MTWPQCVAWVHAVAPHMAHSERSLRLYITQWDVAAKIRQARIDGSLDAILAGVRTDPTAEHPESSNFGTKVQGQNQD